MKTHTDGPWSANLNGLSRDKQDAPQWNVGKTCECLVILPNRSTPEETEANAHLIAAAPDLLCMLERVLDGVLRLPEIPRTLCSLDIEQARKAIAKAKGGA